jgi:hypothetical protein
VDTGLVKSVARTVTRGHVDDAAVVALDHAWEHRATERQDPEQVHFHGFAKGAHRRFEDAAFRIDAGVVDEDVDWEFSRRTRDGVGMRDIECDRARPAAGRRRRRGAGRDIATPEEHIAIAPRQLLRHREPDAPIRAGDERRCHFRLQDIMGLRSSSRRRTR